MNDKEKFEIGAEVETCTGKYFKVSNDNWDFLLPMWQMGELKFLKK